MRYPNLKGKRYIRLMRCSTHAQAGTSLDDQAVLLEAFALEEHQMVLVDEIRLEGVSGSIPGNRTDFDELVERKRLRNDFEVLLVQDVSRLTRSGALHGAKVEYDLAAVGIEVVFAPRTCRKAMPAISVAMFCIQSANDHARKISQSSATGLNVSHPREPIRPLPQATLCIDRLYIGPDGTPKPRSPKHARWIAGQARSGDWRGHRTLRSERSGRERRTTISSNETNASCLCPVIRTALRRFVKIYQRHYVDGWGGRRIAEELNQQGIPSPTGKSWHPTWF